MSSCQHTQFESQVTVFQVSEGAQVIPGEFMAKVQIFCVQCGAQFAFTGLPQTRSRATPFTDPAMIDAYLPIHEPTRPSHRVINLQKGGKDGPTS